MDEKTQAENEALRELFQHPGWAVLMRNTKDQLERFREGFPFNVSTLEQLHFSRGMCGTLNAILGLQAQMEAAAELLEMADEEE